MAGDGFRDGHFVMSVMDDANARYAPARAEMTGTTMRALQRDREAKGESHTRPALIVVAVAPGDGSAAAARISRALEGDTGPAREVLPASEMRP